MKTRFAIALAVAGIAFYGGAAATAWAATFSDDFSSGLRPVYWSVAQTTAGLSSVDDTHGDVQLAKVGTSPGGLQNVKVQLDMAAIGGPITGDFSEQIDFSNAVVGPSTDQVELHVYFQDGSIFFLVYQTGPNVHVWDGVEHGTISVTGNSGTFTISRTGSMLSAYYNGTLIYSETNTSPATAMEFVNQLQPGSDDDTSVTFDNFSLTAATVPIACTPPPPGMISWWPGDGNADDIVGGHNGTLQGGATFAPGLVQQAFSFSAPNDAVTVPDSPAFRITQDLTLDAWINVSAFSRFMEIVMRGDSRQFLDPYYLAAHDGLVRFHIEDANENIVNLEAPINAGEWLHVAGTLENATGIMTLYVNGAVVNQTATTIRPFGDLDPTQNLGIGIGNLQDADGQGFDGFIDEVEIFNRALSATEIQAIVDAGSFGKCKALPRVKPTPRPRPTP